MHTLFVELYETLATQIDDNRNNTHSLKDTKDYKWEWNKEDVKHELAKILNSEPSELEPLFSRLAKCAAIPGMYYSAYVFDVTKDRNFTDIYEFLNGSEGFFTGISFLVEFYYGDSILEESVYVRLSDFGEYYIYDMKPYNKKVYKNNSSKIEDTSKYGIFKKEHPEEAAYIEKWRKSDKDLGLELEKWGDMLWLGRHLHLKLKGDISKIDPDVWKKALESEETVIDKWKDDEDFRKYMLYNSPLPDEKYGDTNWKEISCNVGALTYLLEGEWDLSS